MTDRLTRRTDSQYWTATETAIKGAMYAVEGTGAHPLLTDAIVLLEQAFNKVADYTDLQARTTQEETQG